MCGRLGVYARVMSTGNSATNWRRANQPATSPVCKMSYFVGRLGLAEVFVGRLVLKLWLVFGCISLVEKTSEYRIICFQQ